MTIGLTTDYARLCSATTTPEILDVPDLTYFMIDGSGPPGTNAFNAAIKALYRDSYAVLGEAATTRQEAPMPLQALWGPAEHLNPDDHATWRWTLLLHHPSLQGREAAELLQQTVGRIPKLPSELPVDDVYIGELAEGRCVQALHIGPYENEPITICRVLAYLDANGYTPSGRHHEIYLSGPDCVTPDQLRTIVRLPIVRSRTKISH